MTANKNEFIAQIKNQYDELNYQWSRERDKFEADFQHLSADAKKEYEVKRQEYRKFRAELEGQITELEAAGGNAWEDLKEGTENAWKAMSTAFEKAQQHFKEDKKR